MSYDDAPGLRRRARKDGAEAWYWVAAEVTRHAAAYPLKTVRLHEPSHAERAARCRHLTAELREWECREAPSTVYRGTVGSLIDVYQNDPDSPYFAVRHNTRASYAHDLKLLKQFAGGRQVASLSRRDFMRWHGLFKQPKEEGGPERIRRAHGLMIMLGIVIGFGKSMRYRGCREALEIFEEMRFPTPPRRRVTMTLEHATAIVDAALESGRRSIALGQALQFDLALRQIDVIGTWIPADGDRSGITLGALRWTGGLTWSDLRGTLLTKETTKTASVGEWDVSLYPLVTRALAAFAPEERIGPMILDEAAGRPYGPGHYAKVWRPLARAAGVPDSVWNRDSRSGGITEGAEAGAMPHDLQQMATHASFQTTHRYIRTAREATSRVASLRVARRERAANARQNAVRTPER